ncbi:MAG: cupin domain-containing protein [bacterium]|nr:cupin domain-containing protein [bacterium]
MLIRRRVDVQQDVVTETGAEGAHIRWLIAKGDGAPTFAMREIELDPGGRTPYHSHPWEHEVYVLEGTGVVAGKGGETPLGPGSVVFIPGGEEHNFKNTGRVTLRFLCLIPHPPA